MKILYLNIPLSDNGSFHTIMELNCVTKTISNKVTLDVTHNFELTSQ